MPREENQAEKRTKYLDDLIGRLDAMIGDMCFPVDCCKLPEEIIKIDVGNGFGRYYDKERRAKHPLESDQIPPMWADEVNPLTDFDLISKAPLNKKALEIHEEARRTGKVTIDAKDAKLMRIRTKEDDTVIIRPKHIRPAPRIELCKAEKEKLMKEKKLNRIMAMENISFRDFQHKCNTYLSTKQERLAFIKKTFEDVKKPLPHHPRKTGLTVVKERDFLPNEQLWKFPIFRVLFDSEPLDQHIFDHYNELQHKTMSQMFKLVPMPDDMVPDSDYLGYCIPHTDAMKEELETRISSKDGKIPADRKDRFLMLRRYDAQRPNEEKETALRSEKIVLIEKKDEVSYARFEGLLEIKRKRYLKPAEKLLMDVVYTDPQEKNLNDEAEQLEDLLPTNKKKKLQEQPMPTSPKRRRRA